MMLRTYRAQVHRLAAGALLLLIAGCGRKHHTAQIPTTPAPSIPRASSAPARLSRALSKPVPPLPVGYIEEGTASWYGIPYHGRPAADGEIYDMEKLVAAHRMMPFNTWLRVTNLENSKTVDVRVIDRGPFVGNRIIDLSKAAARQIDLLGPGVGPVRLEVISAPTDIPANDFYAVQVGAFAVYANAERARAQYAQRFGSAQLVMKQGPTPLYRLLVGHEPSLQAAQRLADRLKLEVITVFVVRLDETAPTPIMVESPETFPSSTPGAASSH
jgi:rare lipoprotein A